MVVVCLCWRVGVEEWGCLVEGDEEEVCPVVGGGWMVVKVVLDGREEAVIVEEGFVLGEMTRRVEVM